MAEDVLNLECPDPFRMLQTIAGIPEVQEAALFGRGLHLSVADAQAAIPAIIAALQASQTEYTKLEPIRPSLEDVFVSIIEARDGVRQAVAL